MTFTILPKGKGIFRSSSLVVLSLFLISACSEVREDERPLPGSDEPQATRVPVESEKPYLFHFNRDQLTDLPDEKYFRNGALGSHPNIRLRASMKSPFSSAGGVLVYKNSAIPIDLASRNGLDEDAIVVLRAIFHEGCEEGTKQPQGIRSSYWANLYLPAKGHNHERAEVFPAAIPRTDGKFLSIQVFRMSDGKLLPVPVSGTALGEPICAPIGQVSTQQGMICEAGPNARCVALPG